MPVIILPHFNPVAFAIGPFAVHWYALAYIGGILFAWRRGRHLCTQHPGQAKLNPAGFDDFLLWATLGVVLGGRFGYVMFYQPAYYFAHPLDALKIWQGGMSFHGGLVGVILAIYGFCRHRQLPFLVLADIVAVLAPVGIGLGRLANFVNNELWGRPSDLPWAMLFPGSGGDLGIDIPRHPSQIYEALLEGVVLYIILWLAERAGWRKRPGLITGCFFLGYGMLRSLAEFFREPDSFMGYPLAGLTMGQILSLPLMLVGAVLIITRKKEEPRHFG
ncbi:MAG: prolipoprotein diacylglyceryl transferase [Candidatus Symbiobacter sp.]|nr:prolipoprotein diacylglyceryl transferase [Candidatus Symbiobacter sp.]